MEYIYPDYYKLFKCTAQNCSDTCCAGWQIVIDKKSLKSYWNKKGALGNRLRNSINWQEGTFCQYEQRCAFLNEDNLCDLCLEWSEHALCKTCRRFPRHYEEFENVREISLSIACPEVLSILLRKEDKTRFFCKEKQMQQESYEYFDFFLYTSLVDARKIILEIVQNRQLSIRVRSELVLGACQEIQKRINENRVCEIQELLSHFIKGNIVGLRRGNWLKWENDFGAKKERKRMLLSLLELESLKIEWPEMIKKLIHLLYDADNNKEYEKNRKRFIEDFKEWNIHWEQLMVYFIFTYFCGGVYDEDIYHKMILIFFHMLVLEELLFAKWLQDGKITLEDEIFIIHNYSREVEHSDCNMEKLEKLIKENRTFSCVRMWELIMSE